MTFRDCGVGEPLRLVSCPQCGEPASVEWETSAAGTMTAGETRYVKTHCIRRHWFLLPTHMVEKYPATEPVGVRE